MLYFLLFMSTFLLLKELTGLGMLEVTLLFLLGKKGLGLEDNLSSN